MGIRSLPRIQFKNKTLDPDIIKANWFRTNDCDYMDTKSISNWFLICDHDVENDVSEFAKNLISEAKKKGMPISHPTFLSFKTKNGSHPRAETWLDFFNRFEFRP